MKKLIITVAMLFITVALNSKDSTNSKYGIYGDWLSNSHSADFNKLKDIPNCCPQFKTGEGMGINVGILYEHHLTNSFWFGNRLGIMTLNGLLSNSETTTIIGEAGPEDGVFEHTIDASFMNVAYEPSIMYNPFQKLYFTVGLRVGLNIINTYEQVETIISPAGYGTFIDSLGNDTHKRTRNENSGDMPEAIAFQMALQGGISYEFPLNKDKNIVVAPEISYYFPLTDLVTDTKWQVASINVGVALKYSPLPIKELFRKEIYIDTIKIESDIIVENKFIFGQTDIKTNVSKENGHIVTTEITKRTDTLYYAKTYTLDGSIIAVGVDSLGNEIPNPIFQIEEFVSNRLDPLLNYIFFENNSSELSKRYVNIYKNETKDFKVNSLFRETTLDIYYNILNIVGRRLTDNTSANITLIGCNSNIAGEKGNTTLSQNRAETVRDYLINIWDISADRITLKKRNLPKKASTPIQETDKIQENQRVEIYSDNDKILKPVFIEKIDRTANPPIARFKAKAEAEAGLTSWEVLAYQNGTTNAKFIKTGIDAIPNIIDWELEKFQKIIPKQVAPIFYNLRVEDSKGNKKIIDEKTLAVEITIKKKQIEQFSLILFDFDRSEIIGNNKKIIDFISKRIKSNSIITIKGFTDRTGDNIYNQKLSERRAKSAKKSLGRKDATYKGVGEEQLLYDNEFPEGRFYCRTVNIIVDTPIK